MARIRDAVITGLAQTYNVMLSVVLGDDAEPLALPGPVGPTILSADDLTGDFGYWADAGTTPMSDLAKQQSLERLAPILVNEVQDPALILEKRWSGCSSSRRTCPPLPRLPRVAPPAPSLRPKASPSKGRPAPRFLGLTMPLDYGPSMPSDRNAPDLMEAAQDADAMIGAGSPPWCRPSTSPSTPRS